MSPCSSVTKPTCFFFFLDGSDTSCSIGSVEIDTSATGYAVDTFSSPPFCSEKPLSCIC